MSCQYQGYEFHAGYLDSVCIDGYLWNADSGYSAEDGWVYTSGGEIPCPLCNFRQAVGRVAEAVLGEREDANPRNRKWFLNEARRCVRAYLSRRGYVV